MLYQPPTGGAANDPYVGANPGLGIQGSRIPPKAVEHHQRELITLISKSGLTPSESDLVQVARAVRSQALNYVATAGGTANAITVTLDPVPVSYAELVGAPIRVKIATTSTAAPTLNVNSLSVKSVKQVGGAVLTGGEFIAGDVVTFLYDGTNFQIASTPAAKLARVFLTSPGSGNLTVPTGVTSAYVRLWGGGGGYAELLVNNLVPGATVAYVVGAGGTGGTTGPTDGVGGSTTSFGAYLSATGGGGGGHNAFSFVGAGGNGSGSGAVTFSGGGGSNMSGTNSVSGAGGGAPFGGAGAQYGSGGGGLIPGGGGAGGASYTPSAGSPGGVGAIIVEWR